MSRRRPSRWLAPLAILVVGAATLGIVNSGGSDGSASTATTTAKRHSSTTKRRVTTRRVYVVRSGDTLSSISISTGVPVSRLQTLNPNVDVQALQPGQRLKLRS